MKIKCILFSFLMFACISIANSQIFVSSQLRDTTIFISSSQLLSVSSSPIDILPACDADSVYILQQVVSFFVYNGVQYNTGQALALYSKSGAITASSHLSTCGSLLLATGNHIDTWQLSPGANVSVNQYLAGGKVIMKASANPTTGTGDMYLYIRYYLMPKLN